MTKQLIKETLGWGLLLWLLGYILGIALFMIVPTSMIGWIIMPIGVIASLLVLVKKIKSNSYLLIAISWMLIAVVFDYFFLVKLFKPSDGYYKPDVYLYYGLTFILPLIYGRYKSNEK